jgi:hypothetical protein
MRTRFFDCFFPIISVAILSAVITNKAAQATYNAPKTEKSTQGHCTIEEAKSIHDRGLTNLYKNNSSLSCAEFLAAIDSGKCPGTIASQSPPVVSKGTPPVSQETIYYVREQFRYYDIYDPYDWELNYAGLEPDFFDQDIAIAILVLQRFGIFNVFPQELFTFVNDRAHFRNHIRDIRARIARGDRFDALGNAPLQLATLRPQQGQAINPNALRNTINNVKSANPDLWSGKRAQAGPRIQSNVGKGPMISSKPPITKGVVEPNLKPYGPGYKPYRGAPKYGLPSHPPVIIIQPNYKGHRGPYGPRYHPYEGKGPKFGPQTQTIPGVVPPNIKGPQQNPPGGVLPRIKPNKPAINPTGPGKTDPVGPNKVIRTVPAIHQNPQSPQVQIAPKFTPKPPIRAPQGIHKPAVRPQPATPQGGVGGNKN